MRLPGAVVGVDVGLGRPDHRSLPTRDRGRARALIADASTLDTTIATVVLAAVAACALYHNAKGTEAGRKLEWQPLSVQRRPFATLPPPRRRLSTCPSAYSSSFPGFRNPRNP